MKAIVIKAFRDKENKKARYAPGKEFEAKESRVKELQRLGFLEKESEKEVEEKAEEKAETKSKKKTKKPPESE